MTIILGIDPALHHTGWGVIRKNGHQIQAIASGCIRTKDAETLERKLLFLHSSIEQLILEYQPAHAAIEETYVNTNPRTSLVLGQVRGAILVAVAAANIPLACYPAATIKKVVAGNGRADKLQIQHMIKLLLPQVTPESMDAVDALAIALCHAHSTRSF